MKNEERKEERKDDTEYNIGFLRILMIISSTGLGLLIFAIFGGFSKNSEDMNAFGLLLALFAVLLGFLDYSGPRK